MKALLDNNKVIDTSAEEFDVHPNFVWMDCSDDCLAGWTLIDSVLTAPTITEETYAAKRKNAYSKLNQHEMQYDDKKNSTTTWVDAIDAIKAAHPKP